MRFSPELCPTGCNGSGGFTPGEETSDGKRTFEVYCSAKVRGGCSRLSPEELKEIALSQGRRFGASRRIPPLRFDAEIGVGIVRTWRKAVSSSLT